MDLRIIFSYYYYYILLKCSYYSLHKAKSFNELLNFFFTLSLYFSNLDASHNGMY